MLELIQRTTEFLKGKDVESPRLQAELLLAHVLKLPRMQLYLNFEKTPTTAQLDEFRQYVRRCNTSWVLFLFAFGSSRSTARCWFPGRKPNCWPNWAGNTSRGV